VSGAVDVVVAGAGPAGLAAAIGAARRGRRVVLLDQAARPGVKILISGGNRCNLTHDCDAAEIARAFGRAGGRFLGHALRELGPRELKAWIESLGVPTKVEPGGKVFPVSDRANDVRDALERELRRAGVAFAGGAAVTKVERSGGASDAGGFVVTSARGTFAAPRVVLALGGRSYPKVGTKGDGYAIARSLGHDVGTTTPALVPLIADAAWLRALSGVTLPEVALSLAPDPGDSFPHQYDQVGVPMRERIAREKRPLARGALLFTHFGLSGPAPMNLGGDIAQRLASGAATVELRIDFLPATKRAALEQQLAARVAAGDARHVATALAELVPRRLAEALLVNASIAPQMPLKQLGAAARARLQDALFATRVAIAATRGFDFAEVTRGGVALDEVDPATMQSRRVPGLFLCGELLDLDGPIGGYNFTAAFATGALAGRSAAEK